MAERLTALEAAVLGWIRARCASAALAGQIDAVLAGAAVTKREWTGVGWFVDLAAPRALPPAAEDQGWPLPGPDLESADIEAGGGSLLWGADGYLTCLELFANGSFFNQHASDVRLIASADDPGPVR
ncbi:MAG TPA: hypothetical protein VGE07_00735 [Herpetosiphonaceae bacterium]